jgi:hypothetical protein
MGHSIGELIQGPVTEGEPLGLDGEPIAIRLNLLLEPLGD